ncbi:MAG: Asp-tRNA(Asn)/Glu-tRNA(Gln) amidotransferase GatCAB subunit B, partial [Oscillospiraceae bacterium]
KISKNDAKKVFRIMSEQGGDPEKIAAAEGMLITNDSGKAAEMIDEVLANNTKAVEQYKSGDVKVFGFLMGQCTKALKGVATPKVIKEELEKKLNS